MNLGSGNFLLILAFETIALCLFAIALLAMKNRKLQRLIKLFKKRIKELRKETQPAPVQAPPPPPPQLTYKDMLNEQLGLTKDHHYSLGSRQDISLDLDPDSPLPRRAAAIRHAVLIAEIEATSTSDGSINWDFLASRYQQLLSYAEDYSEPADNGHLEEDLEQTQAELTQARKRINNLERFKSMYLELEERWNKCKGEATEHYTELKNLAAQSEQAENFEQIIENYHATYQDIGGIIERGVEEASRPTEDHEKHYVELQHLRNVAADQHRIITELKEKLEQTDDVQEQVQVVASLQGELNKQARFLQESETCIKLMEDELDAANREVAQLKNKAQQLPELKTLVKDLQSKADHSDLMVDSLKTENRRLAKKLKLAQEAPPEDNDEIRKLRKELTAAQSKYNDLEERFLNLKLQD